MSCGERVLADVAAILDDAAAAELMDRGHEIVGATRAVFRHAHQVAIDRTGGPVSPRVATALTELGEQLGQLVDELRENLDQFAKGAVR